MEDKQLKDKAINIKGKSYVLVSDRINYFNDTYPNGMIQTKILSDIEAQVVVVKAKVTPNVETIDRYFIGHSQAKWGEGMVNKTSALENAETSAVGRALAMLGIGVIDSVASVDEIKKAGVDKEIEDTVGDMEDVAEHVTCQIHKVPMVHFERDGKEWWSHSINGKWCSGRINKTNEDL